MLLLIFFALPLLAALLCMALNRIVPTRWLGVGGALALVAAAAALLLSWRQGVLDLPEYTWITLDQDPVRLSLHFDGVSLPLALVVTGGGALVLLSLALSLPARLRGFGGLFTALLLLLLTTLAGLAANEPLLVPFGLALVALLSFVALRASGIQFSDTALPVTLLAGLFPALALLGVALAQRGAIAGSVPTVIVLVCWTIVGLLTLGAPPFHAAFDETNEAPAGLAGALLALGVPLLGGTALLRFVAAQVEDASRWHVVLLGLGVLTMLVCAAGALGERRLRRLLGWQFSAQLGLLLAALGLPQSALAIAAPTLLLNAVLTTLVSYLAIVLLERRSGTDDISEIVRAEPLPIAGLALLLAASSTIGLPGTWGFWGRVWLFEALQTTHPWAIAPLLAASALLAVAFIAPLQAFWRANLPEEIPGHGWTAMVIQSSALVAGTPLLVFGLLPELTWRYFGAAAQASLAPDAPAVAPALPNIAQQITYVGIAVFVLLVPLLLRHSVRRDAIDPETHSTTMTPDALAESLRWLAWVGAPTGLFGGAWAGLQAVSRWIRWGLSVFEQRYYLAGLMLALVAVVLLLL